MLWPEQKGLHSPSAAGQAAVLSGQLVITSIGKIRSSRRGLFLSIF